MLLSDFKTYLQNYSNQYKIVTRNVQINETKQIPERDPLIYDQ